jgi:hypothetical protein
MSGCFNERTLELVEASMGGGIRHVWADAFIC